MDFAGDWNVLVKAGAAGRLRRKLNHWDMQEDVDFLQSCVLGAPGLPAGHAKQKAHIFLQKLTRMGQHLKITRLPY